MEYLSVAKVAEKWGVSERCVRNYCALGKIEGAIIEGKTWKVPSNVHRPKRAKIKNKMPSGLLKTLQAEKAREWRGGVYGRIQIDFAYYSNVFQYNLLTHDQVKKMFEKNCFFINGSVHVDDIVKTANHFKCFDMIIDNYNHELSERFIKDLHRTLLNGISASRGKDYNVGGYKSKSNLTEYEGICPPEKVKEKMQELLQKYNSINNPKIKDIFDFCYEFENIHPFQDGNIRMEKLLLFKEFIKNGYIPFIMDGGDDLYYNSGLSVWKSEPVKLLSSCTYFESKMIDILKEYQIKYENEYERSMKSIRGE